MQVDLNGAPIVGPADIPVTEGNNTIVYVVGNQPTHTGTSPVVPIIQNLAIPTCDVPGPLPPQPAAGPDAVWIRRGGTPLPSRSSLCNGGTPMVLAADFGLGEVLAALFVVGLFAVWVLLIILLVADMFRDPELSGPAKAGWLLLILVLPFIGIFAYLIVRGDDVGRRVGSRVGRTRRS